MEKISVILITVTMLVQPIWLLLSHIFEKDSIYPQKRNWFIGALGILTITSFVLGVIFGLVA